MMERRKKSATCQIRLSLQFHVEEKDDVVLVELFVSKFLDTSLMDVDVHPDFIRITVKGKVTQLQLPQEVRTDNAHCQRSKTTGALLVTCVPAFNTRTHTYMFTPDGMSSTD